MDYLRLQNDGIVPYDDRELNYNGLGYNRGKHDAKTEK